MSWTEEQKRHILEHYDSIEEYERITAQREAQDYLNKTDYIVIKAYEYALEGKELDKDYTDIFIERERMRNILRESEDTNEEDNIN